MKARFYVLVRFTFARQVSVELGRSIERSGRPQVSGATLCCCHLHATRSTGAHIAAHEKPLGILAPTETRAPGSNRGLFQTLVAATLAANFSTTRRVAFLVPSVYQIKY